MLALTPASDVALLVAVPFSAESMLCHVAHPAIIDALGQFTLAIKREDREVIPVGVASVQALVTLVHELNPQLVHVAALDEERDALMAEVRSYVAGNMVAALMNKTPATVAGDSLALH